MGRETREGRNFEWLLTAVLIREGKFKEAEEVLENRMKTYVVAQRLLDERILERSVLKELGRESEIVPRLWGDILEGNKNDWDAVSYYCECVSERTKSASLFSLLSLRRFGFGASRGAGGVRRKVRRIAVIVAVPPGGEKPGGEAGRFAGDGAGGAGVPIREPLRSEAVLLSGLGALAARSAERGYQIKDHLTRSVARDRPFHGRQAQFLLCPR